MSGPMRKLHGIGVSPGVAFGPAVIVRLDVPDVPNRAIPLDEVADQVEALARATG